MRTVLAALALAGLTFPLYAQTPSTAQRRSTRAGTLVVRVLNKSGNPITNGTVTATGPVSAEAAIDETGRARLTGLRAGRYTVRIAAEGFETAERTATVSTGTRELLVSLAATPNVEAPPPPPPPPKPESPAGEPTTVTVKAFLDKNRIGKDEGIKRTDVGCTAQSKVTLVQLREPLETQQYKNVDTVIQVLEGEGTLRLGERDVPFVESAVFVIPRGIPYSVTRSGRDAVVLLVTLAGLPCTTQKAEPSKPN
jgi:mannose-6-phosphate isomerase-like protein (cupin superfamily)